MEIWKKMWVGVFFWTQCRSLWGWIPKVPWHPPPEVSSCFSMNCRLSTFLWSLTETCWSGCWWRQLGTHPHHTTSWEFKISSLSSVISARVCARCLEFLTMTLYSVLPTTRKDDCEVPGGVVAYRSCVIDNRSEWHAQLVDFRGAVHARGFTKLSHVYDILFAPKLSGEQRLDRPFRRRLQLKPKRQQ